MTILTPIPDDSNARIIGTIAKTTAILLAFLAVAAFGLSFEAVRNLATRSGVFHRNIAWLFPLIVDAGTAQELRQELLNLKTVSRQAENLLYGASVTGKYLARLESTGRVGRLPMRNGHQRWRISPAESIKDIIKNCVLERRAAEEANSRETGNLPADDD
jgi:hypothetical protein